VSPDCTRALLVVSIVASVVLHTAPSLCIQDHDVLLAVCFSLTLQSRGTPGDELEDINPNMVNARRRSNSSTMNMKDFKTKFETIETEPVFEEELHGPLGEELEKQSTTSTDKSVDDEEHDRKF